MLSKRNSSITDPCTGHVHMNFDWKCFRTTSSFCIIFQFQFTTNPKFPSHFCVVAWNSYLNVLSHSFLLPSFHSKSMTYSNNIRKLQANIYQNAWNNEQVQYFHQIVLFSIWNCASCLPMHDTREQWNLMHYNMPWPNYLPFKPQAMHIIKIPVYLYSATLILTNIIL